jgi:uncharacterized membrane protein YgdD (TMEM256/DUF423 family)
MAARKPPDALDRVSGHGLEIIAALAAALAVATGAMGAHAFRDAGDLRGAGLLETASNYLMWHALAALALGRIGSVARFASVLLLASSALFALTLVLLAVGAPGWLGAITPLGGLGMIIGWLLAAWSMFQNRGPRSQATLHPGRHGP